MGLTSKKIIIQTCTSNSGLVSSDLSRAGLLVNDEKCVWQPTQSLTRLGLNWNGDTGTISITSKRIEKVDKALRNLVSHLKTSARMLASAVGMIISLGLVMGSLTRTKTRHCQMSIACSPSWDYLFDLDRYCILELEFWKSNLKIVNCRSFLLKPAATKTSFSDASQLACAAHSGDGKLIAPFLRMNVVK